MSELKKTVVLDEEFHEEYTSDDHDPTLSPFKQRNMPNINKDGKNWSVELAKNIRRYAVDSYALSQQTSADAAYWNNFNTKLTKWGMILSVISTLGFAPILALFQVEETWARIAFYFVTILNMLFVLIIAILNGYKLVYNVVTKISENLEKTGKFGGLYRTIRNQFSLGVESRYNAQTLQDFTTERFNELLNEKLFTRPESERAWLESAPKLENGEIDYDEILPLPEELRNQEVDYSDNDHVIITANS